MFTSSNSLIINKTAVKEAAEQLISIIGTTTTLEVKTQLRIRGYIAFQEDVSRLMDLVAQEEGWAFEYVNGHRSYFVQEVIHLIQGPIILAFSCN